jgi:hypothetical protein
MSTFKAEMKRRMDDMEEWGEQMDKRLKRTETQVDKAFKGTEYVFQGPDAMEKLYKDHVETPNSGGWGTVKKGLQTVLEKELNQQLGLPYLTVAADKRVEVVGGAMEVEGAFQWTAERKSWQAAVDILLETLSAHMIENINTQSRKAEDGSWTRVDKFFVIVVKFTQRALEAQMAVEEVLDSALRRTSGLNSRGGDAIAIPGRDDKVLLIWLNKTKAERERAKAKGKGDNDNNNQNQNLEKGRGRGRANGGGKGRGKKGR